MDILVGCEESQIVTEAFIKKGHNAMSCDNAYPGAKGLPHYHGNVLDILHSKKWDLFIGHPPCTRLTNSVIWYIKRHSLWDEVRAAAEFFNKLLYHPALSICLENPIQHGYVRNPNPYNDILIRKHDQLIQPYNFGENASKATCLWLKNLPPLKPTGYYPPRIVNGNKRWGNQTDGGWNKLGPSETRAKERSRTFQGIADAMAEQWGSL